MVQSANCALPSANLKSSTPAPRLSEVRDPHVLHRILVAVRASRGSASDFGEFVVDVVTLGGTFVGEPGLPMKSDVMTSTALNARPEMHSRRISER